MKTNKIVIKLIVSSCFVLFVSMMMSHKNSSTNPEVAAQFEVPALIDRGEMIQMGKEWEFVQNNFVQFRDAILKNSEDHQSRLKLAQLYIKEARVTGEHGHYYPAALKVLNVALADDNLNEDFKFLALTSKAGVLLSLHDFKSALEIGNKAAQMNPFNAQIHGVLVDAHVELGNYDKAIELADRMIGIKPDIRSYSRISYLREIHGDVEGSIKAMQMAVQSGFPGSEEMAWAMLTLGDLYQKYGQSQETKNIYQTLLEVRPNYPFAVGALGDLELNLGNYIEAESILKNAMNIIPEVGFYISMAELYKGQGRVDEMNDLIADILVMLQEDTESGHNMNLEYADLYLNLLEDDKMAKEFALKEYKVRPDNVDVNVMMARVYESNGELVPAKIHLEKAKRTGAKYPILNELDADLGQ